MTKFELEPLPYDYNALEPYIDEQTMKIHHDKHHQGYTNKLNAAIEGKEEFEGKTAEEIISNLDEVSQEVKTAVKNNGGGYVNHAFFWKLLKKNVDFQGSVADAIKSKFESFENFKEEFSKAAATRFGSGWAWLVVDENGELQIMSTANQDSPLSVGKTPILGLDVWEHAYYLKYQNKRPDYISAFWNVVNWNQVQQNYDEAINN